MAEKIILSCHWTDEEGWTGESKKGHRYMPGDAVSFQDPGHAMLLRQAGYEALDVKPQPAAKKRTAKKAAAKKTAAPAPAGDSA